jgi:hypothetical protein
MTEEEKLTQALSHIEDLTSIFSGNEYQSFLYSHLIQIQVEVNRQLTNVRHSSKIKG